MLAILFLVFDKEDLVLAGFWLGPIALLVFGGVLILSVLGLFVGSWSLRKHLLLWYACGFLFVALTEVSGKLADYIGLLGVAVLLVLSINWRRHAEATKRKKAS